ncbi:MAG: hypothetical protein ONB31_04710 [candidate division KSB1 bacterium]|nr:hypothetical protein [candidate division KSB1 bacterium]MDZ7335227.1 hypothetical protein [candidate division KSB1 bacterium]MDZ7357304.1 hypothetical protein [candidate division KSB1 bacterium]MDZ7401418.1 hypothetical protein [candidate division KSB1 bacterium]
MNSSFDDTRITAFQPKQEKDPETKEILNKLVFKGEAKLNNTLQISDLFAGFRKRLIRVKFAPHDAYDNDVVFDHVSIEDFTVKNKMERIGQGREVERIPVEYVFFTMAVKMDVEGNFLKELYSIFQRTVRMDIEFIQ